MDEGGIPLREGSMSEFFDTFPEVSGEVRLRPLNQAPKYRRSEAELYIAALRGRRRVLDVGCGCGYPSLYIAPHVGEVVGLDASEEMIEMARRNVKHLGIDNARFLVSREDLPFGGAEFDGATLAGVLESIDMGCARRLVQEVRRVLEPGGLLAASNQDWAAAMARKPPREREGKHLVWFRDDKMIMARREASQRPGMTRWAFYLIRPESPSGQKLRAELTNDFPTVTTMGPNDLGREDVLDAWQAEAAQFTHDELSELVTTCGFAEVQIEEYEQLQAKMLFLTASRPPAFEGPG